jgi:endo-1,4-beta-xylanase
MQLLLSLVSLALVLLPAFALARASTEPRAEEMQIQEDGLRHLAPEGFHIGVAVAGGGHHEIMDYPDPFSSDAAYRRLLAAEFNSLTPENQLKWEFVRPSEGEYDFEAADAIVAFAEEHGQRVRGHTLLWHSQNPAWLEEGDFSPEALEEILRDHIGTVVGRYAGRIHEWDVANEIFLEDGSLRLQENIWLRELGPGIIARAFHWAHEADPSAQLFFNDYGVDGINAKSNAYFALIQTLLAKGVPVHGFGTQSHLSLHWRSPVAARSRSGVCPTATRGCRSFFRARARPPSPGTTSAPNPLTKR